MGTSSQQNIAAQLTSIRGARLGKQDSGERRHAPYQVKVLALA